MSLMDDHNAQPTLQVSPGALLSDQPKLKDSKKEKRKGGALSLGRTKPRDSAPDRSRKGKHSRNKSGSRTPPDSPRGERAARGGKGHPSPGVKGHRKRYSQLGLDLSSAESEGAEEEEEEEEEQTYFANLAVSEVGESAASQEPFFTIEKESQPISPGPRTTVQFPVQFEEAGAGLSLMAAFEPQPPLTTQAAAAQSPTDPLLPPPDLTAWSPAPLAPPPAVAEPAAEPNEDEEEKGQQVPETEWRVSVELRLKCRKQFQELQPTHGRLQGDQARAFFIQSRLPNSDLSHIWRLADLDRDNALSEEEFCVAMKLVLLRRKGYILPASVPLSLRQSVALEPRKRAAPLLASHTVGELAQPASDQLLVNTSGHTDSTSTAVEREEPAVATIISLTEEEVEAAVNPGPPSVRRALSLKHFSPPPPPTPPGRYSPPASPFSPPHSTETAPIIALQEASPKQTSGHRPGSAAKAGYHTLPSGPDEDEQQPQEEDENEGDEAQRLRQLAIGRDRGHGRSTSLDLNKMIAGSSVLSEMPAAEPPRPPPKPVLEDGDLPPQTRGRSASTGSISSTGPIPPATADSAPSTRLSGSSHPLPVRKAPLLPPVAKPRRPPPPKRESREPPPSSETGLSRDKTELQTTIRSLKDTNATLQALNRELEEKLFRLMEDRVQLAREVELAHQMQISS